MSALHPFSFGAPPRHALPVPALHIAVLGTPLPGDPRALADRLAAMGHEVTLDRVRPRAAASCLLRRADVAVVAAGDAVLIPLLRARGVAVAVTITGGGAAGRRSAPHAAERFAIREADALVTDLRLVADDVDRRSGVPVELIRPGVPAVRHAGTDRVAAAALVPGAYHLAAGAGRPEAAIRAHRGSAAQLPLVVAGRAAAGLGDLGGGHRVRFLPDVDETTLEQLRAHALTSLHTGDGAGTDPDLAGSMAAGAAIVAEDTPANRELAGTAGFYATTSAGFARHLEDAEHYPQRFRDIGELMRERATASFDPDGAAEAWAALASRLSRGYSSRRLHADSPSAASRH